MWAVHGKKADSESGIIINNCGYERGGAAVKHFSLWIYCSLSTVQNNERYIHNISG